MRLTKDESEINLTNGEAEPEFSDWKWANPQEVIEQVVFICASSSTLSAKIATFTYFACVYE